MKITNAQTAPESPNPHGVRSQLLYDHDNAVAIHLTLNPGQSLRRHITPVDVFFMVLEGTGQVEIGDEVREVSRDDLIESPADIPHRLMNHGDQVFRVLVVKAPKPTTSTRLL